MDLNKKIATRQSYGEALCELGRENENVVVFDADLAEATKTGLFKKEFPERFFDMGISEQDMVSTAAGISTCNKVPYVSSFAMFLAGRAYEQVRNSVGYPHLNVKLCATHSGITVGEDGATHQCLEDIALMREIPGMIVMSVSDDVQTKWAVKEISKIDSPVYLRLCRLPSPIIYGENDKFEIGKAIQIGEGKDATIIATGITVSEAIKAKEVLEKEGILVRVLDIHTIKPIDKDAIIRCAKETKKIITIEDHSIVGGLGSAVCEVLCNDYPCKVTRMGVNDSFGKSGSASKLMEYYGMTCNNIIEEVKKG